MEVSRRAHAQSDPWLLPLHTLPNLCALSYDVFRRGIARQGGQEGRVLEWIRRVSSATPTSRRTTALGSRVTIPPHAPLPHAPPSAHAQILLWIVVQVRGSTRAVRVGGERVQDGEEVEGERRLLLQGGRDGAQRRGEGRRCERLLDREQELQEDSPRACVPAHLSRAPLTHPLHCPVSLLSTVAVAALQRTIGLYKEKGRFRQAADRQKEIATIFQQEGGNLAAALDAFEGAGDLYSSEDATA